LVLSLLLSLFLSLFLPVFLPSLLCLDLDEDLDLSESLSPSLSAVFGLDLDEDWEWFDREDLQQTPNQLRSGSGTQRNTAKAATQRHVPLGGDKRRSDEDNTYLRIEPFVAPVVVEERTGGMVKDRVVLQKQIEDSRWVYCTGEAEG
jgi:hypothetical protein